MIVLGLDPGTEQSALVAYNGVSIETHDILPNDAILKRLSDLDSAAARRHESFVLIVEEVECFGMAVGREVFRTVRWAGRFEERWSPRRCEFVPRRIVKQHICHTARATDANIRQELLDRFGGSERAVGKKATPGPLYGIKSHSWSALALAVTWFDQHAHEPAAIRPGITAEF